MDKVKMLVKHLAAVLLAGIFALLVIGAPAIALTNPDELSIESVKAFRNVAQDGDMVIVFHAKTEFPASYPTTPASSTIAFRLYDTDNNTLLATNAPYVFSPFGNYGYGDIVGMFYAQPGAYANWGSQYYIQIYGVPAYFPGLTPLTRQMQVEDWSTAAADQDSQRDDMADYIFQLCDTFRDIYTEVSLNTITEGAEFLSAYGENYLIGAISGLYAMCPQIFFAQVYVPTPVTSNNYTMDLGEQYQERLQHTDIERGLKRIGDKFEVSGEFVAGAITVILCVVACVICMRKGWGLESGMIVASGIVIIAAILIGDALFQITMIGMLVAAIILFWVLHLKRAN